MKIVCIQCKEEFEFSEKERVYFEGKGLSCPRRCKKCREKNKKDDLKVVCEVCGRTFSFSKRDRDFYREKGYKAPRRCPDCRNSSNIGLKKNKYFEGIQTYGPNINVNGGLINSPGYKLEKMNTVEMKFSSEHTGKKKMYSHTIKK